MRREKYLNRYRPLLHLVCQSLWICARCVRLRLPKIKRLIVVKVIRSLLKYKQRGARAQCAMTAVSKFLNSFFIFTQERARKEHSSFQNSTDGRFSIQYLNGFRLWMHLVFEAIWSHADRRSHEELGRLCKEFFFYARPSWLKFSS